MPEFLGHQSNHFDVDRFGKPGQFLERVSSLPCLSRLLDGNEQCLFWPRVGRNGLWFSVCRYRTFLPDMTPWPTIHAPKRVFRGLQTLALFLNGSRMASWARQGYADWGPIAQVVVSIQMYGMDITTALFLYV